MRVDRNELTFGDGGGSQAATLYGDGVIVRFVQHRLGFSATIVAVSSDPLVVVSYSVSG